MSKSSYREYFASVKKYVRLRPFLDMCSISAPNFSMFMRDSAYDCFLSIEKLELLYETLRSELAKIV